MVCYRALSSCLNSNKESNLYSVYAQCYFGTLASTDTHTPLKDRDKKMSLGLAKSIWVNRFYLWQTLLNIVVLEDRTQDSNNNYYHYLYRIPISD